MQLMSLAGEMEGKALKRCIMGMSSDLQNDLCGPSLGKLVRVKLKYNVTLWAEKKMDTDDYKNQTKHLADKINSKS